MPQRPRVLLLIPHLGGGGAERVTAQLTRGLPAQKYKIHLGLVTESIATPFTVPAGVEIHALGARRVRTAALALLRLVRMLEPNLILSGMAHLNLLVLLLRPLLPRKTHIVIRQNSTASADLGSGRIPVWTRLLYRLLYPSADCIICQSQAMVDDLEDRVGVRDAHMLVLPNPIDADAIRDLPSPLESHWSGPGPHLLAIGRLSPEKGFDLLLRAFTSLRIKFPSARLQVLGIGPELAALEKLRSELHLETSVSFAGYVPRPEEYFPGATLFVLPSRSEGLPNALLEAAAGGLPLVASPCSEGLVHLLRGKRGSWLAEDVTAPALTRALLAALGSIRPGQRFPHSWIESFYIDRAIRSYERLIDQTLRAR